MKIIYLIIISQFISLSFAQDYQERLKLIKNYKEKFFVKDQQKIDDDIKQISDYESDYLIEKDKLYLNNLIDELKEKKESLKPIEYGLSFTNIEKKVKEVEDKEKEKSIFDEKVIKKNKITNTPGHSVRMEKFIKALDSGQYLKADILKKTLPSYEKYQAQEYEDLSTFISQRSGVQDYLAKTIKSLTSEIEKDFQLPEDNIKKAKELIRESDDIVKQFIVLKKELTKSQYDLKFSNWDCAGFECSEKSDAKIYQLINRPDTILFEREGTVRCALSLNSNLLGVTSPLSKESFSYRCVKRSMSGCLDNTQKELCKLSVDCNHSLTRMENAFKKEDFFKKFKKDYFIAAKKHFSDNILSGINPFFVDRNGNYTSKVKENAIVKMMNEVVEKISLNEFKSFNELDKQNKKIIEASRKKQLKQYAALGREAVRDIEYIHNSLISSFGEFFLFDTDKLQAKTYEMCAENDEDEQVKEYCLSYKNYLRDSSQFMEKKEITNLTNGKYCSHRLEKEDGSSTHYERVVLRLQGSIHVDSAPNDYNKEKPLPVNKNTVIEN